jgi:transcriptional regulator with XRE-family HTH domain
MSQKQLAGLIRREDGEAISAQYLNDIEHDRRSPSPDVTVQMAKALSLSANYLHFLSRKCPEDVLVSRVRPEDIEKLTVAFRRSARR